MKKQLAIAIVAILLTAVLVAPPVMAFALRDGNSVQYSYRGYNSITDNSVTASNQPITIGSGIGVRETSSRVKYYRAPVPVRTSNQPIVIDRGIRAVSGISVYSADGKLLFSENFANEIKETDSNIVIIDESDDLNLTIVGETPPPVKLDMSKLMSTGITKNVNTSRVFANDVLSDVASMNEKPVTNRDGFEIKSGTGEIINGTPILYIDTGDEIVPMKLTLIWMGDPSDDPHPSDGSGGYL